MDDERLKSLLSMPKPLESKDHRLSVLWDKIKTVYSDYKPIEPGNEIETIEENLPLFPDFLNDELIASEAHFINNERILRFSTTPTITNQLKNYRIPVNLILAGRVFRKNENDDSHLNVFHQVEALSVRKELESGDIIKTVLRVIPDTFLDARVRVRNESLPFAKDTWEVDVFFQDRWLELAAAGIMKGEMINKITKIPDCYNVFGFAFGLDKTINDH